MRRAPRPTAGRRRPAIWAGLVALAVAVAVMFGPAARRAFLAALFLPDLSPAIKVRPLAAITAEPSRHEVRFGPPERGWRGWLTLPAKRGPFPGLVVSLGVTPAGPNDPRVVNLTDGLARIGVAALVPYSPNLVEGRIEPDDVDFEVEAFRSLAARDDVRADRVGMLGVCVGASLSMVAAADPRIRDDVAVVAWFGGYHRLDSLIAAVASGSAPRDGRVQPWDPDPLAERIVEAGLTALIERTGDGTVPSAVAELRAGPSYARALAVLAGLPPAERERLEALSPAPQMEGVRAPVYLMVGDDDRLVPPSETEAAARALGERAVRVDRFTIFTHVDLDRLEDVRTTLGELARLHRNITGILAAIDAG